VKPLEVKTYPDPCLRARTRAVERFDRDLKNVLRFMADLMYVSEGIGLAATQVGLDTKLFVIDSGDGLIDLVNPEQIEASDEKSVMEEGCLSLPGITVKVSRPVEVKVRAQNGDGEFFVRDFSGLAAKAVQHEMDHLRGKLIIDYLGPVGRFLATRKLSREGKGRGGRTCEVVCDAGRTIN